jgi:hypothetical protein
VSKRLKVLKVFKVLNVIDVLTVDPSFRCHAPLIGFCGGPEIIQWV